MIRFRAATASTGGVITLSVFALWHAQWVRGWRDLGRLHWMHENEEHIPRHERPSFTWGDLGHCECFNCRVVTAWQRSFQ